MRRAWRTTLPTALTLLLVFMLIGCFYLPTPDRAQKGKVDFRSKVGDARSSKPIRPYAVNRARVAQVLGTPDFTTEDGLTDGYVLRTYHGYYFGLCYNGTAGARWYRLRLRFDRNGVLQQYKITRDETGA